MGIDWWWLIALMLVVRGLGLDMIGVSRLGSALRELHAARRELARLAVIEERERLSRDLHDLLGQTLSVITLKSELARGLITEDPGTQCLSQGSGLLGLRERVSGLGGMMKAGPLLLEGAPHFRLRVELPVQPQTEVTARPEERS